MKATVKVDAGICGFRTTACVIGDDDQQVVFEVQSDCEKIRRLGELLKAKGPIDAYGEIGVPDKGVLMSAAGSTGSRCCAGCAVPVALLKGMQVAAGLALPRDVHISLARD